MSENIHYVKVDESPSAQIVFEGESISEGRLLAAALDDGEFFISAPETGLITDAEIKHLALRGLGQRVNDVADFIHKSPVTLRRQGNLLSRRHDLNSTAHAVHWAFETGIFSLREPLTVPAELDEHQIQVLELIAEGNTSPIGAEKLGMSTVNFRRVASNAMNKLGLHTSPALVTAGHLAGYLGGDTTQKVA